jgi:hypothetical protein
MRISVYELLTTDQLEPLETALRWSRARNRAFSLLLVGGASSVDCAQLPPKAVPVVAAPNLLIVALPGFHIDGSCALAESLARRRAIPPSAHVGVAQQMAICPDIESMLGRAEEALRLADEGGIGPVVSMHWADVSRDLQRLSL